MGSSAPSSALDPERAITQNVREAWTVKDGAPAGTITAITQSPDGYLLLGTEGEGLVRFDGVSFERETEVDRTFGRAVDRVTSLITGRDGSLWVGTKYGLARRRHGQWKVFDSGEARDVLGLHEAADGSVWYARHWEGVYRVAGDELTHFPLAGKPRFVTSDLRGALWVGGYEGLWRLQAGDRHSFSAREGLANPNVTQVYGDASGAVWVGQQCGLARLDGGRLGRYFTTRDGLSSDEISAIYVDRNRILWVGTEVGGLSRQRGDRFESLNQALGLTSNRVTAIFEDREGSLWVGTANGLNRLRDAGVLPVGAAEGLSPRTPLSVVEGHAGSVFVSSGFGGLNRLRGGRVAGVSAPSSVPGSDFDGPLFADRDGGVWSGRRGGLSLRRGDRAVSYRVPGQVTALTRDVEGIVFASGDGRVYRLVGGRAARYLLADGSPLGPETLGFDYVWMLHTARDGALWLATSRGAFAVRGGRARNVWRKDALSVRSISEDAGGTTWLGTMAGLVRVEGHSVTTFTARDGLPQDDVYFAVADRSGDLWLSGPRGIARVKREALTAGRIPESAVRSLGVADGMRTSEATAVYEPAGCATADGRVWFTTTDGVVAIDPARRALNRLEPPVVVEGVSADGRELAGRPILVPRGTERLAIRYNGLSLLVPQRVRFRYQLEGYDRDWVDAGSRRAAYYTRLPPGQYRFRVKAANNDGVWNERGAAVEIHQLPHFYQTRSFALAVLLAAGASLWAVHRLRLRRHEQLEAELQLRIQEALGRIKILSGLLPICAWCKKVRDDSGYWNVIEAYLADHSEAELSHGICPECSKAFRAGGRPDA